MNVHKICFFLHLILALSNANAQLPPNTDTLPTATRISIVDSMRLYDIDMIYTSQVYSATNNHISCTSVTPINPKHLISIFSYPKAKISKTKFNYISKTLACDTSCLSMNCMISPFMELHDFSRPDHLQFKHKYFVSGIPTIASINMREFGLWVVNPAQYVLDTSVASPLSMNKRMFEFEAASVNWIRCVPANINASYSYPNSHLIKPAPEIISFYGKIASDPDATQPFFFSPQYFLETKNGIDYPPVINHPEYYYGFIGVALAWQVAFLIIARDPKRYRPLMLATVIEKYSYGIALFVLYGQGRIVMTILILGIIDTVLGTLFAVAYQKVGD